MTCWRASQASNLEMETAIRMAGNAGTEGVQEAESQVPSSAA